MRHQFLATAVAVGLVAGAGLGWSLTRNAPTVTHGGATHRSASASSRETPVPTKAPRYTFTTVNFPGSLDAQISGINLAGAYTGNVVTRNGNRPFIVSGRPGSKPTFFTLPYAAVASTVQTAGIDSAGGVAGTYADAKGVFHGFVRSARGNFDPVDVPGSGSAKGEGTEIAGITPGGVIVGGFETSAKVAVGFIDRGGQITRVVEGSAGHRPNDGTAVEFFSSVGGYGGVYIGPDRRAHGWYRQQGRTHVVNDPALGKVAANLGTQLVGIDARGRFYGIASPSSATTEAFSVLNGRFSTIRDPLQNHGTSGETVLLGVNAAGVVVGFYTYNAKGQTRAFLARPQG
jgi:hypothetical protein